MSILWAACNWATAILAMVCVFAACAWMAADAFNFALTKLGNLKLLGQVALERHNVEAWRDKNCRRGPIYPKNETEWRAMCLYLMVQHTLSNSKCGRSAHVCAYHVSPELEERLKTEIQTGYLPPPASSMPRLAKKMGEAT